MTSDYIRKIKAAVSIDVTKKSQNMLDGAYKSIYAGRSLNFEDLKEYVPGDNIKDIDWKASSRSKNLLVKRYVAETKHNIMLLFDTGRKMLGDSMGSMEKYVAASYAAGAIAYTSHRNGDVIGSVYNKDGLIQYYPFKPGLYNIERILAAYNSDVISNQDNDINKSLEFILKNVRRSMVLFIITDARGIASIDEATIKKLKVRHDILIYNITDAFVTGGSAYNLSKKFYIPSFISGSKKLADTEVRLRNELAASNEEKLKRCGIAAVEIDNDKHVATKTVELLEKQRYINGCR